MSRVDVRLAVLASPERARSLFTVRAAISSACLVFSPRCFALALMCSYCRSRLGLDPLGISAASRQRHWRSGMLQRAGVSTLRTAIHAGLQPGLGCIRGMRY